MSNKNKYQPTQPKTQEETTSAVAKESEVNNAFESTNADSLTTGTGPEVTVKSTVSDDKATEQTASEQPPKDQVSEVVVEENKEVVNPTESTVTKETTPLVNSEVMPQETTVTTTEVEATEETGTIQYDRYAGLSVSVRTLLDMVENHIEVLNPSKPINVQKGKDSQRSFYRTLENIFKLPEAKDFVAAMDQLLKLIKENGEGAFHDKRAYRHWSEIELAPARLISYNYYLSTLINIAKSDNRRETYKAIDFKMAFAGVEEKFQQRLISYFKRLCGLN